MDYQDRFSPVLQSNKTWFKISSCLKWTFHVLICRNKLALIHKFVLDIIHIYTAQSTPKSTNFYNVYIDMDISASLQTTGHELRMCASVKEEVEYTSSTRCKWELSFKITDIDSRALWSFKIRFDFKSELMIQFDLISRRLIWKYHIVLSHVQYFLPTVYNLKLEHLFNRRNNIDWNSTASQK